MASLKAVVFTASIDNEDAIRRWVEKVQESARAAQLALDDLNHLLHESAHVSISLHAQEPPE